MLLFATTATLGTSRVHAAGRLFGAVPGLVLINFGVLLPTMKRSLVKSV